MELDDFLAEWNNSDERVLVHTSGSTGQPKPMWVEKKRMFDSASITCNFLGLKPGDTALLCMPLDYIAGKMMVVRSIERNLRLISVKPSNHPLKDVNGPLTFAAMVPSQVYCSLQVPEEREKLLNIRHLIIGGGAISNELQQAITILSTSPWGRLGEAFCIWSTYGMTETLSHIALRRLNGPDASEWYTPFDSVHVSLNADNCLVIDAPLVHDGPLVTNDIADIRPDGSFRIIGRKDNVICSGGIKLQIEDIEEKLRPYIHVPFCITKCPDEKFGEIAVLLIENGEGDINDAIFSHLSKYEVPKRIITVDNIPMTETGKISRKEAHNIAIASGTNRRS